MLPPSQGGMIEHRLLRRMTYGITPQLLLDVQEAGGYSAWLTGQLDPTSINDSASDMVANSFGLLGNNNASNRDSAKEAFHELTHMTILRAVLSRRQVYEMMVDFWTNHLNVSFGDDDRAFVVSYNRDVIRPHALGKFKDMLLASARSTAMLYYLHNRHSDGSGDGSGVIENYGRELLELHTLGIIDGQQVYTEADMRGASLAMSGWSVSDYEFQFKDHRSFKGSISMLGGAFTANGGGEQVGRDLINFLSTHASTARHVCWKLCKRFVEDDPSDALVNAAAQVYLANDTAIAPVMAFILSSGDLRTAVQRPGSKIRRPFELVATMLRVLDADVDENAQGAAADDLRNAMESLTQPLLMWPSPDGYPDDATYWISTDGMLRRWQYAGELGRGAFDGVGVDHSQLLADPQPQTVGELIDVMGIRLVGVPLTDMERGALLILMGGDATASVDTSQIPLLVAAILCTPSFQIR